MPNKILPLSSGAITFALCLAFWAAPAHAGFQWVAPNEGATTNPPAMESYNLAPTTTYNGPEAVSPLVISGSAESRKKAAETPVESSKIDLSTATITAPASSERSIGAPVQGFATQVPLALALRQLLPSGYSFSIDQGIDIDTLVSYKGGKPWEETLKTMLASVGLTDHRQGTVVTISRADIPAPAVERKQTVAPAAAPKAMVYSAPTPSPMANITSADGWTADRGDTLHKVLTNWCSRAGVELKWLAEYDYPIEASAHFRGGFEDAVRNLLAGFDGARPQPIGELHANSSARQRVLVIQVRGNSYSN